jgi:hypothetical protein
VPLDRQAGLSLHIVSVDEAGADVWDVKNTLRRSLNLKILFGTLPKCLGVPTAGAGGFEGKQRERVSSY